MSQAQEITGLKRALETCARKNAEARERIAILETDLARARAALKGKSTKHFKQGIEEICGNCEHFLFNEESVVPFCGLLKENTDKSGYCMKFSPSNNA